MNRADSIAVVDSGSGNLRSVERALAEAGAKVTLTGDPERLRRADKVVVPGQGAFADCVRALKERGLDEALREVIGAGTPYFGICLGLQVLFEESEEHGPCPGLGLLSGKVVRFPESVGKVPHIGWNEIEHHQPEPLLTGIPDRSHVYFIHSYYVVPADPTAVSLRCRYGDVHFAAAVRKDNVFACQFHPEKSQAIGLRLLQNFVES